MHKEEYKVVYGKMSVMIESIRDEVELLQKWQYLRNNSVERGLAQNPEDYPWLYEKS